MRRSAIILLLMLLSLMIEPLGPWQARERATRFGQTSAPRDTPESRPYQTLTIKLDTGEFVLKNLRLVRIGGSTRLDGQIVNQTKRTRERIVFALKAYDSNGRPLRGVEKETIFSFNHLGRGKSASINSGYGVWLEGIPFNAVSTLEVVPLDDTPRTAHLKAADKYADIEE